MLKSCIYLRCAWQWPQAWRARPPSTEIRDDKAVFTPISSVWSLSWPEIPFTIKPAACLQRLNMTAESSANVKDRMSFNQVRGFYLLSLCPHHSFTVYVLYCFTCWEREAQLFIWLPILGDLQWPEYWKHLSFFWLFIYHLPGPRGKNSYGC